MPEAFHPERAARTTATARSFSLPAVRFSLLGVPVAVDCDDPVARERIAVSYALAPQIGDSENAVSAALHRRAGTFEIAVHGRPDRFADDLVTAVRALNHEILFAVMDRERRHVCIHASVVAVAGRAIVFPGVSHAGKSTLAMALTMHGADFLSDELFVYDPIGGTARAYPRAIKIRDQCLHYFAERATDFIGDGEGRYLRPEGLRGVRVRDALPVGAVIVAAWDPNRPTALVPSSPGRAFLALTASAMNFGSHGPRAIDHLAAALRSARTFDLTWRDAHEAADAVIRAMTPD